MRDHLVRLFPFVGWLEDCNAESLKADFVAGLTVALVLIPQSMAYAQLAGLPAYYGLYAAFLPPMVASLFGSSRQLATGPVAVVSLMTAVALEPLATATSAEYIQYAIALALLVGLFQLLLGVLRLGLVVNLLSHPVVNGFTCAAALIIATSQLAKVFGVHVERAPHHYETVYRVLAAATHSTHLPTLAMAVLAFGVIIGLRRVNPKIPGVLVAVVVATLLAWLLKFERRVEVPLSAIDDPQVTSIVERYNRLCAELKTVAELRVRTGRESLPIESEADLCTGCHEDLGGVEVFLDPTQRQEGSSDMALMLHHKAGLLDAHQANIKASAAKARAALRGLRLVASRDEAEGTTYAQRGREGRQGATEGRTWRILVGSGALIDPETGAPSLTLDTGGAVVGAVPPGLPHLAAPKGDLSTILGLIPTAIIITILGFMEAISIAKAMATETRQELDPNQELIGQGLANICGSFGQSYACSGSFSRSAVNLGAGAVSGLSNVFSSGIVVIALLFFTRLLYHLPQAVLAAIIMLAVIGLLNFRGLVHAWQASRFDGVTGAVSFGGTLILAPHLEWGILLGVALSVMGYIHRTMHSPVIALSVDEHGVLHDAEHFGLPLCKRLAVLRFNGPLNFMTANFLQREVLSLLSSRPHLRHVLIAAHAVNDVDSSGVEMLRDLIKRLRAAGLEFSISGIKDNVIGVFQRSHLSELIGAANMYDTQAKAVVAAYGQSHEGHDEATCPLRAVMPRTTELSLHSDGALRDASHHGLRLCEYITVLRFESALDGVSAGFLERAVDDVLRQRPKVRHVLLAAHAIESVNALGAQRLGELVQRLREDGYTVSFSGFKESVAEQLHATGVYEQLGEKNIQATQRLAIAHVAGLAHEGRTEESCPFEELMPHWTELSLHSDGELRSARRFDIETCQQILIVRCDGVLSHMDFSQLGESLKRMLRAKPSARHVVVDMSTLDNLSEVSATKLCETLCGIAEMQYSILLTDLPDARAATLEQQAHLRDCLEGVFFTSVAAAVSWIFDEAHSDVRKQECPLYGLLPTATAVSLHPDGALRSASRHNLRLCAHIAAIRFDGHIDFARYMHLEREFFERLRELGEVRYVLILGDGLSALDEGAANWLGALVEKGRRSGYTCILCELKDDALDVLRSTGVSNFVGEECIFASAKDAILSIHAEAHRDSTEGPCPLLEALPNDPVENGA